MSFLTICILFIIGLCVGSFLNVAIDRFPKKKSIVFGRSHCEFCKKNLAWYDLVPLFSYLFLFGKCRYCKKFIGLRYPIIEFLTGFIFLASFSYSTSHFSHAYVYFFFLYYIFILCTLTIVFFIDMWHQIIPDFFLLPIIITSTIFSLIFQNPPFFPALLAAFICFGFFFLLFTITKGKGMGIGDIKVAFFIGIFLGWPNSFLALYIAFLTGAIVSLILVIWGKRSLRGGVIPFGPFLVTGTVISLFFGNAIWQQVLHMLF